MPSPSTWTKYFLSGQKEFPGFKSSCLLGKKIENDFLAVEKILSAAKK